MTCALAMNRLGRYGSQPTVNGSMTVRWLDRSSIGPSLGSLRWPKPLSRIGPLVITEMASHVVR